MASGSGPAWYAPGCSRDRRPPAGQVDEPGPVIRASKRQDVALESLAVAPERRRSRPRGRPVQDPVPERRASASDQPSWSVRGPEPRASTPRLAVASRWAGCRRPLHRLPDRNAAILQRSRTLSTTTVHVRPIARHRATIRGAVLGRRIVWYSTRSRKCVVGTVERVDRPLGQAGLDLARAWPVRLVDEHLAGDPLAR